MPDFVAHALDLAACRNEVGALREMLAKSADLRESTFRRLFRENRNLAALSGLYNPSVVRFDRIAWEYVLFGDFRCDLVVGDSVTKAYTFIEYEEARPNSLFVKHGDKATREWGSRFLDLCEEAIRQGQEALDAGGTVRVAVDEGGYPGRIVVTIRN